MKSRRYWLFAGEEYYPGGGMDDYRWKDDNMYALAEMGVNGLKSMEWDWFHVVDTDFITIEIWGDSGGIYENRDKPILIYKGANQNYEKT
ncbi:MAG: hypothetical protein J5I47_07920 [Vicingus serpentipes]|nr:hypothetical protein [Vicingus serpentipes]